VVLLPVWGCPSPGTSGTGQTTQNLTCAAAAIEATRCAQGLERSMDRCAYAELITRVCQAAEPAGLIATATATLAPAAASNPGSGYAPRSTTVFYRAIPGGPEKTATGSPSADPWAVACRGKSGSALAACLRSRFLVSSPEVCAEYTRAFGVSTCGTPAGGWTRGPSNERWGSALQALNYFCENDPAIIGSTGRAGGWDCDSTAVEWARLGAFGGEAIVTEWQRRTEPAVCGNHRRDPGETCANCPTDVGPCMPPPSDPNAIDCSGLTLPAPGAPLFVTYRADIASTGRSEVRQVNCRARP
jgi:hypothetical protein